MRKMLFGLMVAVCPACGDSTGALGQAGFSTDCAPGDQACLVSGLDAPLALGASLALDVHLDLQGSAALDISFVSADDSVVAIEGTDVEGAGEGLAALLVLDAEDRVLDFIHLQVRQPDELLLRRLGTEGADLGEVGDRIQLVAGESVILDVRPAAVGRELMGVVSPEWTIAGDQGLVLLDEGLGSRRRVLARQAGAGTVKAVLAGCAAQVEIEVLP